MDRSYFELQLQKLKKENNHRTLVDTDNAAGPLFFHNGKKYINFSSNNYLNLANHPHLKSESIQAIKKYGTSSSASRLITGSLDLMSELEKVIAHFKQAPAALIYNSGYHANIGVIPALMDEGDVIFSDALNHASLIDGCRLSKAETKIFKHNDINHLESLLKKSYGVKKMIVSETVFSMDGDLAPVLELLDLAEKYNAFLYLDEAHATGVFGYHGRGMLEVFDVDASHPQLIVMGTLGKALGSFGAYVCADKKIIDYLVNRSRSFIYTTALPPASIAASLASIQLLTRLVSNKKSSSLYVHSLQDKLWDNVIDFYEGISDFIQKKGWKMNRPQSPIVPLIVGDNKTTLAVSDHLRKKGIWAHPIRPPTVAAGSSRIRFTFTSGHTSAQIQEAIKAIKEI